MEVLVNARHQPPTNAETVENHEYDAPIELLGHNYHVLETPATGIYATDGYKYTTMYTPSETNGGQSMAVNLDDDEAYHDPTELGSQHEVDCTIRSWLVLDLAVIFTHYHPPTHAHTPRSLPRDTR